MKNRLYMWLLAFAAVGIGLAVSGQLQAGYLRFASLYDENGQDLGDVWRAPVTNAGGYILLKEPTSGGVNSMKLTTPTLSSDRTINFLDFDWSNAFYTTDSTGTGSGQTFTHLMGRLPFHVWVEPTSGHNGSGAAGTQACAISYGTVNNISITVTVTSGCTYRLHAS